MYRTPSKRYVTEEESIKDFEISCCLMHISNTFILGKRRKKENTPYYYEIFQILFGKIKITYFGKNVTMEKYLCQK